MKLIKPLFTLLLILMTMVSFSQTSITNADGSPLKTEFCFLDEDHELVGLPAGGQFSGCGIVNKNGKVYFNSVVARTAIPGTAYPFTCEITYQPPTGNPLSQRLLIHKPVAIYPPFEDTFTCNGSFTLLAETLYAGAYETKWSPEAFLDSPNARLTKGKITSSQVFTVVVTDEMTGCVGTDSILVEYIEFDDAFGIAVDKDSANVGDTITMNIIDPNPNLDYKWRVTHPFGDTTIGTTDTVNHVFSEKGNYVVILVGSYDKCSKSKSKSIKVTELPTSITDTEELIKQIAIYPNPTAGILHISSPIALDATLTTIDGKKVIEKRNATLLSLNHLPRGMYLLRLSDKTGRLVKTETITLK